MISGICYCPDWALEGWACSVLQEVERREPALKFILLSASLGGVLGSLHKVHCRSFADPPTSEWGGRLLVKWKKRQKHLLLLLSALGSGTRGMARQSPSDRQPEFRLFYPAVLLYLFLLSVACCSCPGTLRQFLFVFFEAHRVQRSNWLTSHPARFPLIALWLCTPGSHSGMLCSHPTLSSRTQPCPPTLLPTL